MLCAYRRPLDLPLWLFFFLTKLCSTLHANFFHPNFLNKKYMAWTSSPVIKYCHKTSCWWLHRCHYLDIIHEFCFNIIFIGRLKKSFSRERLETVQNHTWLSKKVMVERYDILAITKWWHLRISRYFSEVPENS